MKKKGPRLEAFYGRSPSVEGAPALEQAADEVPDELEDAAQQRDAHQEIDDCLHNPWPSFHSNFADGLSKCIYEQWRVPRTGPRQYLLKPFAYLTMKIKKGWSFPSRIFAAEIKIPRRCAAEDFY